MKQLKYYILGAISILWFIPIADKLLEVVFLWIEALKIKPSLKILNAQKDVTILSEFLKEPDVDTEYMVEYLDEDD